MNKNEYNKNNIYYKLAVEYDSNLFKFVPTQILLDSQLLLLLKIVNPDRKYKVNIE
jgi:hypothetical protein